MSGESQIAANILTKAVDLDKKKRFTEALICYQEGLHILMNVLSKHTNTEERATLRTQIEKYMNRAEQVKKHVETEKSQNTYHEQILIETNSTGHSYTQIFKRFLDDTVSEVEVDDPYIRAFHQCQNLLRFCELLIKECKNIKYVALTTVENNENQRNWLIQLQNELVTRYRIKLAINYSSTLHDREIRFDNGWIVKIGRGLDYFQGPESKFSVGTYDLDLRKCHETTVDIFHRKFIKKSYG